MQCKAKNKNGNPCKNLALENSSYCYTHRENISLSGVLSSTLGAFIGNMIVPGVGGVLLGASAGGILHGQLSQSPKKKRVFVSFDFDNDKKIKDFLVGQSKNSDSPFSISDYSLKEAAPEKFWERKADNAIAKSDIVLVIVGEKTHCAQGVLKEIAMANARNKKVIQIVGYKNKNYTPVAGAGRLYRWSWKNLQNLLT